MNEMTISEILEDVRVIECVVNAYIDHVTPEILALLPEEETELRQKISAVDDILHTYFVKIHARMNGNDVMDLD